MIERNNGVLPSAISPGSEILGWWRCGKGHEWQARVADRVRSSGCPYCSHRKASIEHNLSTKYPEIAAEWHPEHNGDLKPSQVTPRSGRQVWWLCEKGHEWQTTPHSRTKGTGCPYCSGLKASATNNLAISNPELAAQWNASRNEFLNAREVTPKSGRVVWWVCDKGHEWKATINNRARGTGCPICRKKGTKKEP